MDVRLSCEQMALREAAAQLADRLGPHTVEALADTERAEKLDAAIAGAGWRELRTGSDTGGPWASVVEAALVAEELARGLADTAFTGPTLAAELRRLAGAPAATRAETIVFQPGLDGPAVVDEAGPQVWLAVDARGCDAALVLRREPDGYSLGQVAAPSTDAIAERAVDLTRPTVALPPPPRSSSCAARRGRSATTISPVGTRSDWR